MPDESLLRHYNCRQRGIDVELFVGEQGDQFMVHHAQRRYLDNVMRLTSALQ